MWFSGFRGAMAFALALKSVAIFKKDGQGNIMLAITLLYSIINVAKLLLLFILKRNY